MAHTPPTPPTPAQITADIFTLLDTNGDKSITLKEIEGAITAHDHGHTPNFTGLEKLFAQVDTDHSGGLSVAEVTAAVTHAVALAHDHEQQLHQPHDLHALLALLAAGAHHDWVV